MLKLMKKTGFASIVEIVVTSIVFTIASFGILATITTFREKGGISSRRLDAAYAAKNMLDALRFSTNQLQWNDPSSPLAPGSHSLTSGPFTIDYVVTDFPASEIRQVDMTITYPD